MNDSNSREQGFATRAIRTGHRRTQEAEHSEPIFLTSSYVFDDAQQAEYRMAQGNEGNVYSRYTNPTVRAFETRLASLEGAEDAVATSSGMGAILAICMAFLKSGDHVLCSRDVFGSTTMLLTKYIAKFGVDIDFVSLTDISAWEQSIRSETRLLFIETPSNPLGAVADIEKLAALARNNQARLVVDNCFCTPALQLPLTLGADMVMHSATKYLDGQGRCLGGAVAGSCNDINEVLAFVRSCGPSMSPFNAWVFLKGLETLKLRMQAHSTNALELARWLESQSQVERVYYCGLESHPGHELARRQQKQFSGVLAFDIKGSREQAWALINATQLMSVTANLGDAKTTIIHPATTTHGRLTKDQRQQAGISDSLIRISVGLEDVDDLVTDLQQAFVTLGN